MQRPLVSIIIPCYNSDKVVGEAIESALAQTWPNKEIIAIDDGSKDGTPNLLKSFGDKIRWESGPNRGACFARNRGLKLARGTWIQFLDADDVMLPDCIAVKMATPHSSNERVCCAVASMRGADSGHTPQFWNQKRYELSYIIRAGAPPTPAPLHVREDLLKVGGFRAGLTCAQEFDLHLRMAIQLGVIFVSHGKTGVLVRRIKGSVSDSGYDEMPLVSRTIILNALQLIDETDSERDSYVDAVAQRMTLLGRQLHRMGRSAEAITFANQGRRISPRWYKDVYKSWPATVLARTVGFSAFESLHTLYRTFRGKRRVRF
jgi:glycosyltransferase involved in cell wall biosynthesis